ncbi:hypothetical protein [Abditibacterium utsteinense]|uniref:hypothetical protein n=1 Tax=Abditibacterium utsteinense TaxID=1960156 RepID=UPI000CFB17A2|nr:hypothetical protein [Abditibacterium utsteinense]
MRFSSLFLTLTSFIFCGAAHAQAPKTWNFADAKFKEDAASPLVSPYAAPGGAPSSVRIERKAGALRFTNGAGGSFGLKFNVAPFDAAQFPTIVFNYTRSANTKINFFFKVNGSYYGVIFSGPNRVRPGSFLLGSVPSVGERGRVVIPLRDWLRRFQPKAEKLQVEEMLAGNWDNEGYLLAGIGGNGPGATWSLSSFTLQNATDSTSAVRFGTPAFEGNRIVWPILSGTLDTTKAVFGLDDTQKFGFDSRFLRLETALDAKNAVVQRVVFDAGDAGLVFKDGQKLNLSLESAKESLVFSLGSHASGVPLPRLKWNNLDAPDTLLNSDFEMLGSAEEFAEGGNALVQLDAALPASGQNSLQFTNPRTASTFDKNFKIAPFDAAQFPVLTFAYRNDDRLRLDFRLRWEDKNYFVRFTDRDGAQTKLGEIENIADNQWHRAQISLLDWMKKARPDATNFKVDYFGVSDDAWMGNARAVKWNLDDFRAAPRQSEAIRALTTLRDVAGVSAVSYLIDQKSEGDVDRTPEGGPKLDISLAGRPSGLYWLHLRAQNGSGVWSEVAHFPFFVG